MSESAAGPGRAELEPQLERHRVELAGYCYRMLGSAFETDDAVQETLVRAWRGLDRFDGRSALRSWLYRIATNVCIDMLNGRKRRALPMDLGSSPAPPVESALGAPLPEYRWVEPIPNGRVMSGGVDPAEQAVSRESIRLAFVAALQYLPPRQRAVLILREVLCWRASEVAELLDTTEASVNSALQRARSTLAGRDLAAARLPDPTDDTDKELLARYVDAFERYDISSLVALLQEDAVQSMPPYEMWLRGRDDIARWLLGPGIGCRGSRLVPVEANGAPAFAQYRPSPGGGHEPWSIQVIEVSDGRIAGFTHFLDTNLFAVFGLPPRLD
ncbi:sigma-70 family RNA polymerase sigma factor [Pseudonocardia acidicola]|uniref:sigma-70 family RNA polymerase sigma factor n=1 Tax=Pseudonocardia acidicola TaxID=2724939 RepID=UPI003084306E